MLATGKHFPGFGAARANTDNVRVTIHTPRKRLRRVDERPYRELFRRGVRLVMLSTAIYPALHPGVPAAFSRRIARRELRGRLGFRGVSMTDALGTPATAPVRRARPGRRARGPRRRRPDALLVVRRGEGGRPRHRARDSERADRPLARGGFGQANPRGQAQPPLIDTHCHLEMCEEWQGHGLKRVATVGIDEEAIGKALALADAHEEVHAIVGRHPNSAAGFDIEPVRKAAEHPKAVAIGETGLDFYRDRASREDQERAFSAQMELAESLGKPLVIHTRAAEEETLKMLAATGGTVVMHCFSMPAQLDECLERGYFISFAGNVTYPKATDLQEAAARVPADRLLVETDAPFLAPQPVRGKPNRPANVVHTAEKLAELRGVEYAELEAQLEANAARGLRLVSGPGQHPPAARVRRPPEPRARPELPRGRQRAAAGRGRGRAV